MAHGNKETETFRQRPSTPKIRFNPLITWSPQSVQGSQIDTDLRWSLSNANESNVHFEHLLFVNEL